MLLNGVSGSFLITEINLIYLLLRRTGMSGAVMVRISTREYDNSVSQNAKSNRRSTKSIPHITKY